MAGFLLLLYLLFSVLTDGYGGAVVPSWMSASDMRGFFFNREPG